LLAIVVFAALVTLAFAAGFLGIWLGVLLVPAFYRYLLLLLEARASGRSAPVAGIELFDVVENFWSLTPLILLAAAIWIGRLLATRVSGAAALAFGLALFAVLPASLGILAVTRSPAESLNPAAWWRLVRACGPGYLWAVLVPLAGGFLLWRVVWEAIAAVAPSSFLYAVVSIYDMVLLFTVTGAVLNAHGVQWQVDIPAPVETGGDEEALSRARRKVLNHAWGFVSRGNATGGLKHIERAIAGESDTAAAWQWYFASMLEWPSPDPALQLARSWLGCLLRQGRDIEALKLMTRCLRENPAFRPWPADAAAAAALARRFRRDDLLPGSDPEPAMRHDDGRGDCSRNG
jgi:hypothetical protein